MRPIATDSSEIDACQFFDAFIILLANSREKVAIEILLSSYDQSKSG
ncbi:hypothetical protein [Rubinisphaera sp.]|nr:hypothetical protein [Rubinisphaera sp.]